MFAVVQVLLYSTDDININEKEQYLILDKPKNVILLEKFETKELANDFIENKKQKKIDEYKKFGEYVNSYVDAIEVPLIKNNDYWIEYCKKYFWFHCDLITIGNFKETLKEYLISGCLNLDVNYKPPIVNMDTEYLFVLEI